MGSKPDVERGVAFYKGRGSDFTILGDISPTEFIAVHEPWHDIYRYLIKNDLVEKTLAGEYDHLFDNKHQNEAKAIEAIKINFGK
jgi:hypothetical protein